MPIALRAVAYTSAARSISSLIVHTSSISFEAIVGVLPFMLPGEIIQLGQCRPKTIVESRPAKCYSLATLANDHSKSSKHHVAMQALYFAWYNFSRKHEALKGPTPAMADGLSDHV